MKSKRKLKDEYQFVELIDDGTAPLLGLGYGTDGELYRVEEPATNYATRTFLAQKVSLKQAIEVLIKIESLEDEFGASGTWNPDAKLKFYRDLQLALP